MRRPGTKAAEPTDLEWGVSRGLSGFRGLAWGWAVAVAVVTRTDLSRPGAAAGLLAIAGLFTAAMASGAATRHRAVTRPVTAGVEVLIGATLLVADGWVYDEFHGQTFGSAWPVAAVLNVGVLMGPVLGVAAGLVMGLARATGSSIAPFGGASALALTSSAVLYMLAGGAAGAVMGRVRQAETTMARARAREEVARTLHDGVLQTLAVVQRRTGDRELAALAREQELELRAFLAAGGPAEVDLGSALRRAAAHIERHHGLRCEVVVIDDEHEVDPDVVAAVAGAAREAMNNAAKHASASRVTVMLDVGEEVFVSVKDNGAGFDADTVAPGRGLGESVHARMAEVGGRATVDGRPGDGAEVRLMAPLRPARRT